MDSMTPQDALGLLDEVTAQVNANRKTHGAIQRAVQVLAETLAKLDVATPATPATSAKPEKAEKEVS